MLDDRSYAFHFVIAEIECPTSLVGHFRESGGAVPEEESPNAREREPLVTA